MINVQGQLTAELKRYIKSTKHIDSGNLLTKAKVIKQGDSFVVEAPEYIIYLDNGEFVNNFFNLPKVLNIIAIHVANIAEDLINE